MVAEGLARRDSTLNQKIPTRWNSVRTAGHRLCVGTDLVIGNIKRRLIK